MQSLSREELQSLKAQAMIVEKGGTDFSVRLSVTGGHLEAAELQTVAVLADRFDGQVRMPGVERHALQDPLPWFTASCDEPT